MKKEDIKKFLEFRKKFSKLEWHEINEAVRLQENKRAGQIVLDDSDYDQIIENIKSSAFTKNLLSE